MLYVIKDLIKKIVAKMQTGGLSYYRNSLVSEILTEWHHSSHHSRCINKDAAELKKKAAMDLLRSEVS